MLIVCNRLENIKRLVREICFFSVGRVRPYPLIRVSEDVLDYLVHVLPAPAVGAADLEGGDVGDAQLVRQRFMGVLRDAVPERAAGDVD